MRYVPTMYARHPTLRPSSPGCSRLTLLAVLGACQAPTSGSSGFSSTPEITTVPAGSTGDTAGVDSTGPGPGSTSMASGSTSGESGVGETTLPVLDLGTMPDLGDGKPVGCKGKIDLLFVISRTSLMANRQAQLVKAFPKFIETIESKFDDFDYHIMVIDGDDEWGSEGCNEVCPALDCKVGDPCCSANPQPEWIGKPCCTAAEDYPCGYLDGLPDCETKIGAGTLFPAGTSASNKLCPIDEGRRYMVKGQKDLADTFACVAQIGASGGGKLGEALTAAMQKNINGPGGCNDGFLREDALLMLTFIQTNPDHGGGGLDSDGYAEDWAKAVLDAKHGDAESVVMLTFANPNWEPADQIWKMARMFPYYKVDRSDVDDHSPAFEEATTLVETACAGFVVPG